MDSDMDEAKCLLQQHRDSQVIDQASSLSSASASSSSSSSWLSRKPVEGVFTYKEVNHVLGQVIDRDGPVGLVEALLELGADINYSRRKSSNIWKTICRKDQQSRRNDVFLRATIHCPPDVVQALAAHADQANLDSVLHHAIARADLAILETLLQCGADPSELHDDFENIVFRDELPVLELLLSGPKKPCLPCRSAGLRLAVKNQSAEAMRILLRHGADVNHDDGAALLRAVDASRPDFVAILISAPVRALAYSLDAAVGRAYAGMEGRDTAAGREMIEMCLAAGARGPESARLSTRGLADIIRRGQEQLLDAILRFAKPSGEFETMAILEAIKTKQISILARLLKLNPSQLSLAAAVTQAMSLQESTYRLEAVRVLLSHGAQGDSVASAFVVTVRLVIQCKNLNQSENKDQNQNQGQNQSQDDTQVQDVDRRLFDLLLNEGKANVDYSRGEALQQAVKSSSTDIASQILSKNPSPESLGAALPLAMSLQDRQEKKALVHMLLQQSRIPDAAVNTSLVEAVRGGPENRYLVELLLGRASVNYNAGEAISCAIRNLDLETLKLLLCRRPSYGALETAIAEALRVPKTDRPVVMEVLIGYLHRDHLSWALGEVGAEPHPDLSLVKSLLQAGADIAVREGVCVRHAARNLDIDTLQVLSEISGTNEAIYTAALGEVVGNGRAWIVAEHLDVIDLLLARGASGAVVDKALVEVVSHLAGQEAQAALGTQLLDRLFAAGASVNFENGKSAGLAASRGDAAMLRRLLGQGASVETASLAFSAAIFAHPDEHRLLELIDVFMDDGTTVPDVNTHLPGMPPPIFLCLKGYFNSTSLVERLVAIGCDLQVAIPCKIYADENLADAAQTGTSEFPQEPVSVLFWALLQPETMISTRVITALIACGANVAYTTPKTRITALMLAAKYGRLQVVEKLLEAGLRASAKDALGRSALFYASRDGNTEIVRLLLKGRVGPNDGSLHEATRELHRPVMKLLMEAGHEPNYRSAKHGGRTALAEMALKGRVPDDDATAVVEEVVDLLKDAGADPLCQVYGKSIIFMALDNPDPVPMTALLLDKILWKTINDEANVYREEQLFYSPTMYICKKKYKVAAAVDHGSDNGVGTEQRRSARLLELLRNHGAVDRYYAAEGQPQPADAVGVPAAIWELERERRARQLHFRLEEEAHQAALRREAEQATNRARIADLAVTAQQHSPTSLRYHNHHHHYNHNHNHNLRGMQFGSVGAARKNINVSNSNGNNEIALRHAASMNDEALRRWKQQRSGSSASSAGGSSSSSNNEALPGLGLEKGWSAGRGAGRREITAPAMARMGEGWTTTADLAAREARVLGGVKTVHAMRMLEKQADGWKMVERVGPPVPVVVNGGGGGGGGGG